MFVEKGDGIIYSVLVQCSQSNENGCAYQSGSNTLFTLLFPKNFRQRLGILISGQAQSN